MIPYQTKIGKLSGTSDQEVYKQARTTYKRIKSRSKRNPYIRAAYFNKQKVFFDFFWKHLAEKNSRRVRTQRLKYFACAVELVRKSRNEPISKENPNRELFFVQIKEDRRTDKKYLMSVFAPK